MAPNAIFASVFLAESVLFDGPIKHGRDCLVPIRWRGASQPYWLKLARAQHIQRLRVWGRQNWTQIASATISMAENADIGLFVDSGTNNSCKRHIDNVSLDCGARQRQ